MTLRDWIEIPYQALMLGGLIVTFWKMITDSVTEKFYKYHMIGNVWLCAGFPLFDMMLRAIGVE